MKHYDAGISIVFNLLGAKRTKTAAGITRGGIIFI